MDIFQTANQVARAQPLPGCMPGLVALRHGGAALAVGRGWAGIAGLLRAEMGLVYVELSECDPALGVAGQPGHGAWPDAITPEYVKTILAGRDLAVILVADMLEEVADPRGLLGVLRAVAVEADCPLVVSVRNVAHMEEVFNLLAGRWDGGIAIGDGVPPRFTAATLDVVMRTAGWQEVGRADEQGRGGEEQAASDWVAVAGETTLWQCLDYLRSHADSWGHTRRFVRTYRPGPAAVGMGAALRRAGDRPFLSVITRTQGRRLDTLRDVLLCLSAQECQDFELVVVGHKLGEQGQRQVRNLIDAVWPEQPTKARLVCVEDGNRTTPLNVGFGESRGRYVAILDDDDVVFGHWVETFKALAHKHPGRVLRARAVAQTAEPVHLPLSCGGVRAISGMGKEFLVDFDLFAHLTENRSPPVSLAFPRFIFHDLGFRFDEAIATAEDWDFLMRVVLVCGVADDGAITGIYRWWSKAESALSVHAADEWLSSHKYICAKLDAAPLLLPAGSTQVLRRLACGVSRSRAKSVMNAIALLMGCLRPGAVMKRRALAKQVQHHLPLSARQKWWLRNRVKRSRFFRG